MSGSTDFIIQNGVLLKYVGSGGDVVIPDGVREIHYEAFESRNLTSVTIPKTVTSIGTSFRFCRSLMSVFISDGTISIEDSAFQGCESLSSITIPESVKEIGNGVFYNCRSLKSIVIPESVTRIGSGAFDGTPLYQDESNWECGILYLGNNLIKAVNTLSGEISIKPGTKIISDWAFFGCSDLICVRIPNSVTSIGRCAFQGCENLTNITIPQGTTYISSSAFQDCSNLTSITIPPSVIGIGDDAFKGTAYYQDEANWCDGVLYICSALIKVDPQLRGSFVVKPGITVIGSSAFNRCSFLTDISLPESVAGIGSEAFRDCLNLTDITLPESLVSIGDAAFSQCSSLSSIALPKSTREIGIRLFEYCYKLSEVILPDGLNRIGNWMFRQCNSLESITIPNSIKSIGYGAFSECKKLTNISILKSVMDIDKYAFENCQSLSNVTIPSSVTRLGDGAFINCTSLERIVIPATVAEIGCSTFSDCVNLRDVVIEEGVSAIGKGAFSRCRNLTNMAIPSSVTSIDDWAFRDCSSLESLTLSDGLININDEAFWGCCSMINLSFPKSIVKLGRNLFYDCKSLKQLDFSNRIDDITSGAFKGCEKVCFLLPETLTMTRDALSSEYARGSIETSACGLAHLILFQRTPLWKGWRNSVELASPQCVFDHMISLVKNEDPFDKKMAAPVADIILRYYKKLSPTSIQTMLSLFDGKKCKEITAVQKDEVLQAFLENQELERHPAEIAAETLLDRIGTEADAAMAVRDGIRYRDSNDICSREVLRALLSVSSQEWKRCIEAGRTVNDTVEILHDASMVQFPPEAEQIADALDTNELSSFLEKLATGIKYRPYLLACTRFANEASVNRLLAEYRKRLHGDATDHYYAENLAEAILISPTRAAMLFCDRNGNLSRYSAMRGMTEDELRDKYLSDIGLDEQGGKPYDLGNQTVIARLQKDMSFIVELPDGKTVKSLPKKGSDPVRYENAKEDFAELKRSAKRIVKNRGESLFHDFLCRNERTAKDWKDSYLKNPLLRGVAELVVWSQGHRSFILSNGKPIDSSEKPYSITEESIFVAHPIEMEAEEVKGWQHYFTQYGLKQPFLQVWEPVINPVTIQENRYLGSTQPMYRFTGKDKHGIHSGSLFAFSEDVWFELDGCELEYHPSTSIIPPNGAGGETYILGRFTFREYNRQVNHIVSLLDSWTVEDRIKNDDLNIADFIDNFTFAQITSFIKVAQEAQAVNVLAFLLDYKNAHFADFDPMDEFTLE